MESRHDLDSTTISELEELMTANADRARILRDAAKTTDRSHLSSLFDDIAGQREKNAKEIQGALALSGEYAAVETSLTQPLRSWWMKARDSMQEQEDVGLLSELERAEDKIVGAYKDTLVKTAGSPLNATLHDQFSTVKQHHDRIRDLRDAAKERS